MTKLVEVNPLIAKDAFSKFEATEATRLIGPETHPFEIQVGRIGVNYRQSAAEIETGTTGLLQVNIIDNESPNRLKRQILEMRVSFDREGDLIGLDKNQFIVWHYPGDRVNYHFIYQTLPESPELAEINSVRKYDPNGNNPILNINPKTALKFNPYFPERVNWVESYGQLILGQTEFGRKLDVTVIKRLLLVPAE